MVKTKNLWVVALALAGIVALLAYRVFGIGKKDVPATDQTKGAFQQIINGQDTEQTPSRAAELRNARQGVDYINKNFGRLAQTGETIARLRDGFSVNVKGAGTYTSGTISRLQNVQDPVFLGVKKGASSSELVSRELRNIRDAVSRGLSPFASNRVKDYLRENDPGLLARVR